MKPIFHRCLFGVLAGIGLAGLSIVVQAATITVNQTSQCGATATYEPVNCAHYPPGAGDGIAGCSIGEALVAARNDSDFGGCTGAQVVGAYEPADTIVLQAGMTYPFGKIDNIEPGSGMMGAPQAGANALPSDENLFDLIGNGATLKKQAGSKPFRLLHVKEPVTFTEVTVDGFDPGCSPTSCGDGVRNVALGEQCDDGNTDNGDGCSESCQLETCGDSVKESYEECDSTAPLPPADCQVDCLIEKCGNGRVEPFSTETCDDGNTVNGDGCDSSCHLETPGTCGNGIVGAGEQCDDKNTDLGDGCSDTCQWESRDRCFSGGAILVGSMESDGASALATLALDLTTFRNNKARATILHDRTAGGAVAVGLSSSLDVTDSNFEQNVSDMGGAIAGALSSTAISRSIFSGNSAKMSPGTDGPSGFGGSILLALGQSVLMDDLIQDGTATFGGGVAAICSETRIINTQVARNGADQFGGGLVSAYDKFICGDLMNIDVLAALAVGGPFFMPRSSIVVDPFTAIMLEQLDSNLLHIESSTIAENKADHDGGGIYTIDGNARVYTSRSVWGDNHAVTSGPDCAGSLISLDDNIFGDDDACTIPLEPHDLVADPVLVADCPSANKKCKLQCNSPALDNAGPDCPYYDNLAVPRYVLDGRCDRGAFEQNDCTSCGNGAIESPIESCDDGNTLSGDGCSNACILESCGNGVTDAGEQCEPGVTPLPAGASCSVTCIIIPPSGGGGGGGIGLCGDGVHNSGEECDDGNNTDGDGCSSGCREETPTAPPSTEETGTAARPEACGNGVCESSENNANCPADCSLDTTDSGGEATCAPVKAELAAYSHKANAFEVRNHINAKFGPEAFDTCTQILGGGGQSDNNGGCSLIR